ncbi:MAG: TRAP transporter small permease subunit [Marinibacterium sp.]|nr:TRAP transporter small permease subunit [Marinibacterium sp.]
MSLIDLLERPADVSGRISALLVVPLVLVLLYEVIARYVLRAPTAWAYDLTYMLMGSVFLMAMSFALKIKQHVNVDLILPRLPVRLQALINVLCYGALLPVLVWMSWYVGLAAVEAFHRGEVAGVSAWNPVIWPFKAVWCLGFALLALQVLAEWLKALVSLRTGLAYGGAS